MSNEKSETSENSENSEIIKIRSVALAGGILQLATLFSLRIVLSPWDIIEFLVLSRTSISLLTHTYYRGVNHLKKTGRDFFLEFISIFWLILLWLFDFSFDFLPFYFSFLFSIFYFLIFNFVSTITSLIIYLIISYNL